jgi:restriction endonuclease S subunit
MNYFNSIRPIPPQLTKEQLAEMEKEEEIFKKHKKEAWKNFLNELKYDKEEFGMSWEEILKARDCFSRNNNGGCIGIG